SPLVLRQTKIEKVDVARSAASTFSVLRFTRQKHARSIGYDAKGSIFRTKLGLFILDRKK
ncbi:MAG: hypothetical protein LH649_13025, partial [Pseudanabaena sp. CAN_BIN31]|nr:hypothetical protein [Pseudanabaena sp. CAN_BIN31]